MKIISAMTGIPFVWSNHADDIPHDFMHRAMTFYGGKTICVSTDLKRFCMDKLHIPQKDIRVIIHGINPDDYAFSDEYVTMFKAKHGLTYEKIIGLFARMGPGKGHFTLIDALAQIPEAKLKKQKTVFFGGTHGEYVEQLKEKIKQHGLEQHILFEDFVTPSEALSLSDITVLPSEKEGFGIVSIESFLMKKPHIRTKTGGYEDIKDGCIGVEIGDSAALSQELCAFLDGKDYAPLVEAASHVLKEKCTLQSMAQQILDVYREVARKG